MGLVMLAEPKAHLIESIFCFVNQVFLVVALPDGLAGLIAAEIDSLGGGGFKTGNEGG